ncbi:MAG: twin-arginine translocation signal domain-containing protein [Candidatus Acidiferrales bacterium]
MKDHPISRRQFVQGLAVGGVCGGGRRSGRQAFRQRRL